MFIEQLLCARPCVLHAPPHSSLATVCGRDPPTSQMRGSEKETPFPLPKSGKKMALGFEPRQLDSRVYPLATTPASPTPLELGICSVLWTWEQVLGKHPKFLAYNFHLLHPLCSSTQQQDWGGSSCHRGEGQGSADEGTGRWIFSGWEH